MEQSFPPKLSVAALYAERDEQRRREQEGEEQLKRKRDEELAAFRKRLNEFQVTEGRVQLVLDQIRRAFERHETELMLTSFPSSFCTDQGRAITNAGARAATKRAESEEPEWLATLPAGARQVYEYWKANLKPGGFRFNARIINYPEEMPGDVGLFFSWPRISLEN